jgi:sterol desaturase/sphingolipid hydroxylase (fatty acid hydroxylase superfamily)
MHPIYILLAIPFFLLFIGLELLYGHLKKRQLYRFSDAVANLCIGIGNQAFNLVFKGLLLGAYIWVEANYAFFHQSATWWSFVLALIGYDFFFYWAHRWSHEINFFWGAHVVHHSSEEYNLSVALRQSWWHNLLAFVILMPLPFLGFDPLIFFLAAAVHTLYQFWIHTRAIGKLPRWIEFVFNTPSHHRVHHGRNPKYIDKNHAGVFILFDRIFGTFQVEEEEPTYGITTPLKSWNPTWANLHYYVEMWSLARKMPRWKDRLRMIWARPGWLPKELGGFQAPPKITPAAKEKYESKTSRLFKGYALVQFSLVMLGLAGFMWFFEELSWPYRLVFLGLIVLSLTICGALLENKRWVYKAEYLRLGFSLVSINAVYYQYYADWWILVLVVSAIAFVAFNLWFTLGRMLISRVQKPHQLA